MRMAAVVMLAGLLVLGACGGDDGGGSEADRDPDFRWASSLENDAVRAPDFEGHKVWVDEKNRTVYIRDCATADRATTSGGPYGPTPRDPVTQKSENGYAPVCDSATDRRG